MDIKETACVNTIAVSIVDGYNCLTFLNLSQRNWFHISQPTSMVAIGLQKPYAKMDKSCLVLMFIDSRLQAMVTSLRD